LLSRLGQDVQRWLVIVAEQAMGVGSEAITRQAGIENGDLSAGTAELQGGGEAGKAASDNDDVIHDDGLSAVDKGWSWAMCAISSSDTRPIHAACKASALARKSPITVLNGLTMPHGRPGEHDVENKLKLMHWLAHIRYFEVP